jgi:putative ATP-binding cassette transporter
VVELRDHRSLFSLILSEHTTFDRLYGLGPVDPARVNAMLDKFGVAHATRYEDGRFTRIELSSGQKKRVGLVAALLEDKPVLVLDEWAAEQDPDMRARYYLEILPALKAAGKAIVAVTHDDRYLHECDQLVLMRDGRIRYAGPPVGAEAMHAVGVA